MKHAAMVELVKSKIDKDHKGSIYIFLNLNKQASASNEKC